MLLLQLLPLASMFHLGAAEETKMLSVNNPGNNCTICMETNDGQEHAVMQLEVTKQPVLKVDCLCKEQNGKIQTTCQYYAPVDKDEWFPTSEHVVRDSCAKQFQFRLEAEQSNLTLALIKDNGDAYIAWSHPRYGDKVKQLHLQGRNAQLC